MNLELIQKALEGGDIATLQLACLEVWGKEINVKCGGCIEDAKRALANFIKPKLKPMTSNFEWIGNKKATVILSVGGKSKIVSALNCTDADAAIISSIPKYSHLVKMVIPTKADLLIEVDLSGEEKEIESVGELLEVTTLTSNEAPKEESGPKKRGPKRKSK